MKRTLAATALALLMTTGAFADENRAQVDVPHADLNLANPVGAQVMLKRIAKAAEVVCGGRPSVREMHARYGFNSCVQVAVATAVAQLNAPLVTALHEGRDITDPRFAMTAPETGR
jgi:UrcA family protein